MTHLWPAGVPIAVRHNPGLEPQAFRWQEREYRVQAIAKRWRLDQSWWQQRVWREYFKLTTSDGLLVIIYLDLLTGQWYLQRLYD
ncbi:MAG: hypothetical protein FOGNACKC_06314 [Anaerolineae bacterium]|nr:hypothetical protein [Anaerolineae bacterium]